MDQQLNTSLIVLGKIITLGQILGSFGLSADFYGNQTKKLTL